MNFDWKNIDLKNACIFDLTDDIELIRKIVCDRTITLKDKDIYKREWSRLIIACNMHEFAEHINDTDLINKLDIVFEAEYAKNNAFFNE